MKGNGGTEFCKKVFKDIEKYNVLWNNRKVPAGKRKSPTASGAYAEEVVRKWLPHYIGRKDIKFISGIICDKKKMSPQVDIIVCKPSREEDAFQEYNGFVHIERVFGILEIKSFANRGINGIETDIEQIQNIWPNRKFFAGILWVDFRGNEDKIPELIKLSKEVGIVPGIVGWFRSSNKCQKEFQDKQDRYFCPAVNYKGCWELNYGGLVDRVIKQLVDSTTKFSR